MNTAKKTAPPEKKHMVPFSRDEMLAGEMTTLFRGRWGNADLVLVRRDGCLWVVKDFSCCPAAVRNTWVQFIIAWELSALKGLEGIDGVPQSSFRLDRFAFAYRFIEGKPLRKVRPGNLTREYFLALEQLVQRIHKRHIVHLDLRHNGNILVTAQGLPAVVDFQSHIKTTTLPRRVKNKLFAIDLSGVYKHWFRKDPDSLDPKRFALLNTINEQRRFWFLKGYVLGTRKPRRT